MSTDSLTSRNIPFTADSTVDAVIERLPGATAILNAHNVDTCCGGGASLREAAVHAHADLGVLIELLEAAPRDPAPAAPNDTGPVKACSCGCK